MEKTLRRLAVILILLVLGVGLLATPALGKVRVVEGQIEYVNGDTIQVQGRYFSLGGVPLLDPSGNEVSPHEFRVGRKVAVYQSGAAVTSVLIYDDHMVE